MSKMSELHMELTEQANELGFESLEEALDKGYEVDTEAMANGVARLCIDREQEEAHKAWLKEKEQVLKDLHDLELEYSCQIDAGYKEAVAKRNVIENVIDFIEKGEM